MQTLNLQSRFVKLLPIRQLQDVAAAMNLAIQRRIQDRTMRCSSHTKEGVEAALMFRLYEEQGKSRYHGRETLLADERRARDATAAKLDLSSHKIERGL